MPSNSPVRAWWKQAETLIKSAQHIVENSIPWSQWKPANDHGVYFLVHDKRIQYVGVSIDVDNRLMQHRETYEFDAYFVLTGMPVDRRGDVEGFYIQWLSPLLNSSVPMTTLHGHLEKAKSGHFGNPEAWLLSGHEFRECEGTPQTAVLFDGGRCRTLVPRWRALPRVQTDARPTDLLDSPTSPSAAP